MCETTVEVGWAGNPCHFAYTWGSYPFVATAANGMEQMTFTPAADTTVHQWMAAPQGGDIYLRLRQPEIGSGLLKFDLSALPPGAEITSVKLKLCVLVTSNDNRLYFTAYPVQEPWDEATAMWPEPAFGDPMGWGWLDDPVCQAACIEIELDPAVAQTWLADPSSNHGLLLRGEGSPNRKVEDWLASREHGNGGMHPQLIVEYNVPD
jgi:hypothetical protein